MYRIFSQMIKSFDREDLEDLYKLVKARYGSTRLVESMDYLLWNDMKIMFEPHVEAEVWKLQNGYKVLEWKLYDSYGVHFLRMQSMQIYMLVEKKYPLTPPTLSMMLEKKLQINYEKLECVQLSQKGILLRVKTPRNQDNKNKESSRRSVPMRTSTSTALVSCDGLGGYDWSDQAKEGLLSLIISSSSSLTQRDKKINIVRPKAVVNAVKGNNFNVVKVSACWVWKPKHKVLDHVSKHNNASITLHKFNYIDAQGRSKHMTGNMSYLTYYKEIDIGYVAFGGNPKRGKITGKDTIKTGTKASDTVVSSKKEKEHVKYYILIPLRTADPPYSQDPRVFEKLGEGSANLTDPHHTPTITQLSTSQPQKTQKPRKPKRKNTQVPQPSGSSDNVTDKAVHKELGNSLVRAATTASSLEAEHDNGNITKTLSKATYNESSSLGTTSGSGPSAKKS
ncbi:hypothetical protein Tco_0638031 [Tanacetum coccineum]